MTCVVGSGALLVDRECVSTSCLGVGMSTRTDGLLFGSHPYLAATRPPATSCQCAQRDRVYADPERRELERQTVRTLSVSLCSYVHHRTALRSRSMSTVALSSALEHQIKVSRFQVPMTTQQRFRARRESR